MTRALARLKPRHLLLGAVGVVCVILVLAALLRPAEPAPFIVLHRPIKRTMGLRDRIGQLIPTRPGWGWAWNMEQAVFGTRRPVNIQCDIFKLTNSADFKLTKLLAGTPGFSSTNGLRAWLLGTVVLEGLRNDLKNMPGADLFSQPRLGAADGVEGRLFVGQTIPVNGSMQGVGVALDCLPRIRRNATDLLVGIQISEPAGGVAGEGPTPIRTNLDAILRLQIPKGQGLLLLNEHAVGSAQPGVAVVINPSLR